MANCPYCGSYHASAFQCPRIKSIEYQDNGMFVRKIEFHAPVGLVDVVVFQNDVAAALKDS